MQQPEPMPDLVRQRRRLRRWTPRHEATITNKAILVEGFVRRRREAAEAGGGAFDHVHVQGLVVAAMELGLFGCFAGVDVFGPVGVDGGGDALEAELEASGSEVAVQRGDFGFDESFGGRDERLGDDNVHVEVDLGHGLDCEIAGGGWWVGEGYVEGVGGCVVVVAVEAEYGTGDQAEKEKNWESHVELIGCSNDLGKVLGMCVCTCSRKRTHPTLYAPLVPRRHEERPILSTTYSACCEMFGQCTTRRCLS